MKKIYYDIRDVGYEFMAAEKCMRDNDIEGARKHYKLVIDNYEYADNDYLLNPDSPYTMIEFGVEQKFPSINEMVKKAERMLAEFK